MQQYVHLTINGACIKTVAGTSVLEVALEKMPEMKSAGDKPEQPSSSKKGEDDSSSDTVTTH